MWNIKLFSNISFLTGTPVTVEYYISPLDVLMGLSNTGIKTVTWHITSNPLLFLHLYSVTEFLNGLFLKGYNFYLFLFFLIKF